MKLLLGKDFPASPPKGYFLTKIFHPNVGANGEICVNVLKRDWTAELGIRHVLLVSPVPGPWWAHCFSSAVRSGGATWENQVPAFLGKRGAGPAGWAQYPARCARGTGCSGPGRLRGSRCW